MALVFRTFPDSSENVDIVGAGRLFPNGKSGIVVSDAALVMPELQEKNQDGSLKLDDSGNPIPLTGSALTAAAKAFAEARGITTDNVKEADIPGLPLEAGVPPDRPPLAECGREDFVATYGDSPPEPVNTSGNEQATSGAGVPTTERLEPGSTAPGQPATTISKED